MRIINEKNLAYSDQPAPLLAAEAAKKIEPRKAAKPIDAMPVDMDLLLPIAGEPKIEAGRGRLPGSARLRVGNFAVGKHVFGPKMKVIERPRLAPRAESKQSPLALEGWLPDHLDLVAAPDRLSAELATPPFVRTPAALLDKKRGNQGTTVFSPDNRRVFNDTRYPWSTCGRVDSPLGQASGTMIGPRHLLTVSHVIQWNGDGSAGWVRFRPSYFDGSTPFGEAWGALTYFKYKVSGPTIDWIEGMYDYVVVVLDRPIGNLTGWMGSRGYTDGWDGAGYWSHVGYPGDLTAGNRPTFENGIALDGAWWEFDSHEQMSHRGDVWPGQSGGSFFAWWSGESYPSVVAVQSAQNSGENLASGGQDMVDLIIQARREHP